MNWIGWTLLGLGAVVFATVGVWLLLDPPIPEDEDRDAIEWF